jgi:signal peptidase I
LIKKIFTSSIYSLRKSKNILRHVHHLYLRKKKKLSETDQNRIKTTLLALQQEIQNQNREKAHTLAVEAENYTKFVLKKSSFDQIRDLIFALAFALFVAVLVRQMWFEFYEIPSGSMRPTLKEQDRLVVSKTDFGINLPLAPEHLYFDPAHVKRSGIVIFTGENMDIPDVDTLYFYLFPGKKQYIKRLIGKPGDTLYFYGGQIYGVDSQGNDISQEFQLPRLEHIDHIPFIHFEGKVQTPRTPVQGMFTPVVLHQMNEPVAKLSIAGQSQVRAEMLVPQIADYSDLWGFGNFASSRLLTKDQVKKYTDHSLDGLEEGILYLELKHHPSLTSAKISRDEAGRLRPVLGLSSSLIPLQERHVRALFDNMYTARFIVKNGFARRYGADAPKASTKSFLPHLIDVPDGSYEFYYGKAYAVKWQGITEELPPSHPLYRFDPQRVQLLYNMGMEFDTRFMPQVKMQKLVPARYAYFRDQNLYLLGAPLLLKGDSALVSFLQREEEKAAAGNAQNPYRAFKDNGPPTSLDFIKQYGITVPPKMYLVLGDNHAMSSDSRYFGFVPESNLRGTPDFIFWPPGKRWGIPNQPPYPWITLPRVVIWICAALALLLWYYLHRKKNKLIL